MLSEDLNYSTHPQFPTKQFHSIHIETSTFKPSQATPKPCELKISRLFMDNYLYYPYAFDRTIIICINVCSETYFIVDPNTCVSWTHRLIFLKVWLVKYVALYLFPSYQFLCFGTRSLCLADLLGRLNGGSVLLLVSYNKTTTASFASRNFPYHIF